jgi:hypothetical protein
MNTFPSTSSLDAVETARREIGVVAEREAQNPVVPAVLKIPRQCTHILQVQ